MARLCSSKPQESSLKKNLYEDEHPSAKCKFTLNTSLKFQSEDLLRGGKVIPSRTNETNLRSNNLTVAQNPTGRLKFQCHYEERKRRAELRRKKIIQNLKKNYQINVEGFNEDVTREIIRKAELLEKEKKERDKRNVERSVVMITRLLEEQKYKNRGSKSYHPPWRKNLRGVSRADQKETKKFVSPCISEMEQSETSSEHVLAQEEERSTVKSSEINQDILGKEVEKSSQEEKPIKLPKCQETVRVENTSQFKDVVQKIKRPLCVPTEMSLESTPKCVVFQDYKKGKVYLQDLKITNIGSETIHCRYLGILVHTKSEERFPVGVAVRDSVKLRPGLSCSTKIRLCSQDDTKELQGSVIYETRRRKNPSKYYWFFVRILCVPVQAVVEVIPSQMTFPSLSWCEAMDPKNSQLMKKILKIKNSGGKPCSCKIFKRNEENSTHEEHTGEVEDVGEEETVSSLSKLDKERLKYRSRNFARSEEFVGEDYLHLRDEAIETSLLLLNELVDDVFVTFRFCPKNYIEILPYSTVQVEVKFIPQYKGFHHEIFLLQFENCDNCNEKAIEMKGDIKRMPLRIEPQVIDFKICISNSGVYAKTFKIFNESNGPYSVILKVPPSVKEHAHVYPKSTTISPRNNSDFSLRIYPRVSLARDAPRYYSKDSQILEFPVFIYEANSGACKKDRIKIYAFALITDYCLQLSPSYINFGTVTTLETVRMELELTNHSLAVQEYGFLNLPKGVRVEPNMGFGRILPKESIILYLLFSPEEDLVECENSHQCHEFQIAVTSIAKYGGFRETPEPEEESIVIWGEDYGYEFPYLEATSLSNEQLPSVQAEDSEDFDVCEYSSDDNEETFLNIDEQENKIRNFLKEDRDKKSEFSFFKRMDVHAQDEPSEINVAEDSQETSFETSGYEEAEQTEKVCKLRDNLHIVRCRAFIMKPRCRLSESVIQLPATPCSSFSLYRFRLNAINEAADENCSCGFRKVSKQCWGKPSFKGSFEFQYFCPHIKLEPESGFLKAGDSLPITIIFRPEFPANQLRKKSRLKKAEKFALEKMSERETPATGSKQSKGKQNTSKVKSPNMTYENLAGDTSLFDLENYDLFAGERCLQELISPFYVETKLRCIVKTFECEDESEKIEIHEMVLICPATKPNFIYLGSSQEIKFNKVLVGTRSQILLQIQNISFERISPSATFLSPAGPFHCSAGVKKVEVDPEHIWRQPLIYAPLKCRGIEKQFFEIYCDSTNIFLTVSGEGVEPQLKITPNFVCCLIISKLGVTEELKLEIENLTELKLNLIIKSLFVREGPDIEKEEKIEEEIKAKKSNMFQKEEVKDSKKLKNVEKNIQYWEEIPEIISSKMETLVDIEDCDLISRIFILSGVGGDNGILIPSFGKQQIKILFAPPANKSGVIYAIKYTVMLEGVFPLKEMLVMGKIAQENS